MYLPLEKISTNKSTHGLLSIISVIKKSKTPFWIIQIGVRKVKRVALYIKDIYSIFLYYFDKMVF